VNNVNTVMFTVFTMHADYCDSQSWNPMADDYLSERNSYQVDVDDPGVATVGYSKLSSCDV